jgi:hypothetical protein
LFHIPIIELFSPAIFTTVPAARYWVPRKISKFNRCFIHGLFI